jgi:hypothetical protein
LASGLVGCCPVSMKGICTFSVSSQSSDVTKPQVGTISSTTQFTLTANGSHPANYTLKLSYSCFGTSGTNPSTGQPILVVGKGGVGTSTWTIIVSP